MPKKNEWPSDWKKVSVCMSRFTRKETRRNVDIIRKKVDALEMWCWRRVMRVSWMERKTNVWVLETSSRRGHWKRG